MTKNVLFSLKNCKSRQTLEALPPDSHISHPALWILLSAPARTNRLFRNRSKGLMFLQL